jgi:hypothetical protein
MQKGLFFRRCSHCLKKYRAARHRVPGYCSPGCRQKAARRREKEALMAIEDSVFDRLGGK